MRRTLIALCLLLCARAAYAGDFVDTRLNFNLVSENVLVKPGESNPSVAGVRVGTPNSLGILFFDNYDTRYTGYENLTHLVLYRRKDSARVTTEAALVVRFLEFSDVNLTNMDDGSYIRFAYWLDRNHQLPGASKRNLALTVLPLNSDRMRLGYSYRISWGGSPIYFKINPDIPAGDQGQRFASNTNPAPGAKLQLSDERWYIYLGVKTTTLLDRNPNVNEPVARWAGLAGAGVDVVKSHVRLEANGGFFDRGTNPLFYGTAVAPMGMTFVSYPVQTFGASAQLSIFNGLSPTQSIDYSLYRNDPMVSAERYFARPVYTPGFTWLVSAEATGVGTTLQNPDKQASTKIQQAYAGDVNLRAQKGHARFKMDLEARSLSFILLNQPSLVPYQDFPAGSDVRPEIFGSLGFDYNFERLGLTIGPTFGIERPATFTPPPNQTLPGQLTGNTGGTLNTSATIVVRSEGDLSILHEVDTKGNRVRDVPIIAAKLEARKDFLEWFAGLLQVYYQYDGNQTHIVKGPDGTLLRTFNKPQQLGFNLTLQARF
jgi:hypothetical protein